MRHLLLTVPFPYTTLFRSESLTVKVASSATGVPPPVKLAVPPATTIGRASCREGGAVLGVLVTAVLAPLLALPSLTCQLMVRVVSVPPAVGRAAKPWGVRP